MNLSAFDSRRNVRFVSCYLFAFVFGERGEIVVEAVGKWESPVAKGRAWLRRLHRELVVELGDVILA